MIHSIAQCVWYLTKGFLNLPSFHILPLRLWVEFWVGGHTCITYFAKSNTRPQGDTSHTLWSRCVSVWNKIPNSKYFWYFFLSWFSLLDECLLESMGYLYFFSFFFFSGKHLSTHYFIFWTFFHFFSHTPWHGFSLFLA
jgi:hypothetical protein